MSEQEQIKKAVGISYDQQTAKSKPVISSKGEGAMAEAIVAMANDLGIYVHKDEALLHQLEALKEGEEVPKDLYQVIATILAFSYLLQGKTPAIFTRQDGSKAVNITT